VRAEDISVMRFRNGLGEIKAKVKHKLTFEDLRSSPFQYFDKYADTIFLRDRTNGMRKVRPVRARGFLGGK
jgi:hypothetical protein